MIQLTRVRNNDVIELVDDRVMQRAVNLFGIADQLGLDRPGLGPADDGAVRFEQRIDLRLARLLGIERGRLAFEEQAELEGIADQVDIDMRHLHATLRHRADQPLRFQPRDQFADRAQRQSGEFDQFALREELTGLDVRGREDDG